MWHIASVKHHGAGSHRTACRHGKHHRGFSHPARFEILEERLALAAPAGGNAQLGTAADFGTSDLGGFLMQQNGLEPLPGSASEANGNDPAQIALVGVWGTADPTFLRPAYDYLAFNNPSWVPNDRTLNPIPFSSADNNGLPINVYQAVGTPSGIRNFEIGANTSMAHGNGSPLGRPSAAARPAPVTPKFGQVIEHPLDEGLLAELFVEKEVDQSDQPDEYARLSSELEPQLVDLAVKETPQTDEAQEGFTLALKDTLPGEDASEYRRMDEAAVDQMMDEDEAFPAAVCEVPLAEVAAAATHGNASGIQAVAASIALGATLTMRRPGTGTSLTELVVRAMKQPWLPQRDSHGKNHT